MRVLIVEDELLLAKNLQKTLMQVEPSAVVCAVTQSVEDTMEWLQNNPAPDLLLMDIELADGRSFDVFKSVAITSPVIFTTAYDEYALKAFKVNSIDYLLKPILAEELRAALQKYKNTLRPSSLPADLQHLLSEIQNLKNPAEYRTRFLVKQGKKMVSIAIEEIAYIFSEKHFCYLRTNDNQKYLIDYSLDELEKTLSPADFFRVNRQYIISNKCVQAIHSWFNQKLIIELKPAAENQVIISREKANSFKAWMGN
jgi:two-component system, LytTR family, response regulator LytT